jgi:hypothetical protein
MKHLFVGGVADGEWIEMHEAVDVVKIPGPIGRSLDITIPLPVSDIFTTTIYKRLPIIVNGEQIILYIEYGKSAYDAFGRLFKGYSPKLPEVETALELAQSNIDNERCRQAIRVIRGEIYDAYIQGQQTIISMIRDILK